MTPKMVHLFENSLASRGVQMRYDYGRDFFLDADYYSFNIFVRSINDQQSIFADVGNINLHFHHLNLEVFLIKCSLRVILDLLPSSFSEHPSWCWRQQHGSFQGYQLYLLLHWMLLQQSCMLWRSHYLAHRKRLKIKG